MGIYSSHESPRTLREEQFRAKPPRRKTVIRLILIATLGVEMNPISFSNDSLRLCFILHPFEVAQLIPREVKP
jgi:hypothetical protein